MPVSIASNHTRNKGDGTNLKAELLYAVCKQQFKFFSAPLLTFAP